MGWGDELMAAGEVSKVYTGEPVAILGSARGSPRSHAAWENNPQIQKPHMSYRQHIINGPGTRPYATYDGRKWIWKKYQPVPAPMYFNAAEYAFAQTLPQDFIVLEPNCKVKDEAVNRDWGWHKWQDLADLLKGEHVVQLSAKGLPVLNGVQHIPIPTPRHLAIAMTRARAFVSTEGGFHHTAASALVPGVVIYGHFNSPMSLGYKFHEHLFSGGMGCGLRVKCPVCRQYMDDLRPQTVADALSTVLTKGHNHG